MIVFQTVFLNIIEYNIVYFECRCHFNNCNEKNVAGIFPLNTSDILHVPYKYSRVCITFNYRSDISGPEMYMLMSLPDNTQARAYYSPEK